MSKINPRSIEKVIDFVLTFVGIVVITSTILSYTAKVYIL